MSPSYNLLCNSLALSGINIVNIWYGGSLAQQATTNYPVAMVSQLPWQPE